MSKTIRTISDSTRNQSTAKYSNEQFFISGSRYKKANFLNSSGADIQLEDGIMVMRDTTTVSNIKPITAEVDLPKFIGFAKYTGEKTVADAASLDNVNFAINGEVDSNLIVFPAGVTLDTVVGDQTLGDLINGRGFVLTPVTELGVFDN